MSLQEVNLKDFDLNLNDFASAKEGKKWETAVRGFTVAAAKAALRAEQADGNLQNPNVTVDRRATKDLTSVRFGGKITFSTPQNMIGLIDFLWQSYEKNQVERTGNLKFSTVFMMNQRGIDPRNVGDLPFRVGDDLWFMSMASYARYVEQGLNHNVRGRRQMQNLALRAKRKYGANFHIDFRYKMVSYVKPTFRYSAIKKRQVYDSDYVKARGVAIRPAIRVRIKTGFTYH